MKRLLCLWFPHWPLQRLVVARPVAEGEAVAIIERDPRRGERVAYCSRAAWLRGVRIGMPPAEAEAMCANGRSVHRKGAAPTAPLLLFPQDRAADRAALLSLAVECERFSPLVGTETADNPESLLCDVTGIGPLFGGEEPLAAAVIRYFAQRGYRPRVGVASTVGAAWALAHFGAGPMTLAAPHDSVTPTDCYRMPLAALRLAEPILALLDELGVITIGQLLEIPRAAWAARFGPELLLRLDQLQGAVAEPIAPHRPLPELVAETILEHPVESQEVVAELLQPLVERLAADLRRRGQGAVRIACRLDCAGGAPVLLRVGLYRPSAMAVHLQELLHLPLEQTRLPGAVGRIGLSVLQAAPLVEEQAELFAGPRDRSPRPLACLIDRLSSRLGRAQVLRGQWQRDPQPEQAVLLLPAEEAPRLPVRSGGKTRSPRPRHPAETPEVDGHAPRPLPRPLRLVASPEPLAVVALAPAGPPMSFERQGHRQRITRFWGPERIETGWWRGRTIRRDYYRVETVSGHQHWLFRELTGGRWFWQGSFE